MEDPVDDRNDGDARMCGDPHDGADCRSRMAGEPARDAIRWGRRTRRRNGGRETETRSGAAGARLAVVDAGTWGRMTGGW